MGVAEGRAWWTSRWIRRGPSSGCTTVSPSSSMASRRAASGGASPGSMCPPAASSARVACGGAGPCRGCPPRMADAVTWTGSACSLHGSARRSSSAKKRTRASASRGEVGTWPATSARRGAVGAACRSRLAQMPGEHGEGVAADVHPIAVGAHVQDGARGARPGGPPARGGPGRRPSRGRSAHCAEPVGRSSSIPTLAPKTRRRSRRPIRSPPAAVNDHPPCCRPAPGVRSGW